MTLNNIEGHFSCESISRKCSIWVLLHGNQFNNRNKMKDYWRSM